MNLLSKIGSYDFLVEPFHCDFSNHIFLGHLGNHLLNAADFHSNERGYGMDYLNTVHKTWVLRALSWNSMRCRLPTTALRLTPGWRML